MNRQAAALILSSLVLVTPELRAGEVERWNRVATDAAIAEQMDPLNESRVFAIVHAAIHNALNAIDRRYEPYRAGVMTVPSGASPEAAVAAAAHASLVELIPARRKDFDAALAQSFAQIELGLSLGKPLFLHSRDAHPRFAEILKHHGVKRAVAHCFTGEREELRAYLDLGLYVGITGWICDERRGRHLLELVKEIPRDKLLLETDAPYLTPRDLRPQPRARRNEPAFLPHILNAVARALGRPPEEVAAETSRNAIALFSLHESGSSAAAHRPLAA